MPIGEFKSGCHLQKEKTRFACLFFLESVDNLKCTGRNESALCQGFASQNTCTRHSARLRCPVFKSRFFSENHPKFPFRGKGLHFGGRDENGQNEAETDGFGNCDAKISAGQGIAAHRRRNDERLSKLPRQILN